MWQLKCISLVRSYILAPSIVSCDASEMESVEEIKVPRQTEQMWRKCSLKLLLHFLPRFLSHVALTSFSAPEADRDGGILGTVRFIWKYQAPKLARSVYLNLLEEQLCDFRCISKNGSRQFIAFLPSGEDPKYIISHQKDIMFDWLLFYVLPLPWYVLISYCVVFIEYCLLNSC